MTSASGDRSIAGAATAARHDSRLRNAKHITSTSLILLLLSRDAESSLKEARGGRVILLVCDRVRDGDHAFVSCFLITCAFPTFCDCGSCDDSGFSTSSEIVLCKKIKSNQIIERL